MNNAIALAPRQALTNVQAIFWGGLVAGVLDAVDGVIAYGTEGLNPIRSCSTSRAARWVDRPSGAASLLLPSARHFILIIWGSERNHLLRASSLGIVSAMSVNCLREARNG